MKRIRLGMVGGGRDAFIGSVHRIAARLDDHFELVAGALSSDPVRARESGRDLALPSDRTYETFEDMAAAEAARSDGIEAVSIVTPNNMHAAIAKAFLQRGVHVICDKPLAVSSSEAAELVKLAKQVNRILAVTYNYTGYPMVRQAREMCRAGALGNVRLVHVEYLQDWLANRVELLGSKQAEWRTDPARAGAGGAIGDIGTHAYHLMKFITGLQVAELCAELSSFAEGRRLDDDARVLLRFDSGARGVLWASQVATGNENELAIRVYGDKGGLTWAQSDLNRLVHSPLGEVSRIITRGSCAAGQAAARVTRIPGGHPEGYLEAFATIYAEVARAIHAAQLGQVPPQNVWYPDARDGLDGVRFVEATVRSSAGRGAWVSLDDNA
jgi:predicted dehydrogenase